jgi:DNA-binding LytR/AlgR family response regulator
MNAIIIEDEPRAARRLETLINEVDSSIHILAKLESISTAKAFLNSHENIELIFSDIQLADGLCFEIYENLASIPPIIFTTAYDQYAIKAFKNNGIDYLLKPIATEDLAQALQKLKQLTKPSINVDILSALASQLKTETKSYKERFMVKVGQHIKSIGCDDIYAFYSLDKATYILTKDARNYIIDHTLDQLEHLISPENFFRINRKFVLNINAEFEITAWTNSRLKISLPGYDQEMIIVARNRTKEFKQWLGES